MLSLVEYIIYVIFCTLCMFVISWPRFKNQIPALIPGTEFKCLIRGVCTLKLYVQVYYTTLERRFYSRYTVSAVHLLYTVVAKVIYQELITIKSKKKKTFNLLFWLFIIFILIFLQFYIYIDIIYINNYINIYFIQTIIIWW